MTANTKWRSRVCFTCHKVPCAVHSNVITSRNYSHKDGIIGYQMLASRKHETYAPENKE